jgi:uncharacterized protein YbjT (DUF2867 family)
MSRLGQTLRKMDSIRVERALAEERPQLAFLQSQDPFIFRYTLKHGRPDARKNIRAVSLGHHVAASIVGIDRLSECGYFRVKIAQEKLIKESSIPYSIVRATQFFEFVRSIADGATEGNEVRMAPVLFQPMAADDVASAVGRVALDPPLNGTVEIAGPEQFRFDELIRPELRASNDPREVITDPHGRYFGAELNERSLVPGDGARLGETRFADWRKHSAFRAHA